MDRVGEREAGATSGREKWKEGVGEEEAEVLRNGGGEGERGSEGERGREGK